MKVLSFCSKLLVCVLLIFSSDLSAQYFIAPPNGKTYDLSMLDPVVFSSSDHERLLQFFKTNGYVVVDDVSDQSNRDRLVALIDDLVSQNIPQSRRVGFLDLYHDDALAQLRQDPRLYNVFATIFETPKLWVVFDRVIYQTPAESEDPLNPHVDQNPVRNPEFFNVQAMLALRDMNESTGTLALVPKSHEFFHEYATWVKPTDGFVEHQGDRQLQFVGLRLKMGQLVIWDSRTTHSRFRAEATSNRYAALLTFTKAKDNKDLSVLRQKYFEEGIGWNNHEAGLRATSRPRCEISLRKNSEQLTLLGQKLYGQIAWEQENAKQQEGGK